jgi:hypothetical protein
MAEEIRIPLPEELVFSGAEAFLLRFCLAILIVSVIRRIFFKQKIDLQHSVVSALGILMIYAACIAIFIYDPMGLKKYLSPLPFMTAMTEEQITLLSFTEATDSEIFNHLLFMLLVACVVNQIYHFEPKEVKFLGWIVFRMFSTGIAIVLYIGFCWALPKLHLDSLPEPIRQYGPIMVLGFILLTFLIGSIKRILSFFMKKLNPAFEGLHTFYFTNKFGLQISRGLGTTLILAVFFRGLDLLGYHQLPLGTDALVGYLPLMGLFFLLWVLIGSKL